MDTKPTPSASLRGKQEAVLPLFWVTFNSRVGKLTFNHKINAYDASVSEIDYNFKQKCKQLMNKKILSKNPSNALKMLI